MTDNLNEKEIIGLWLIAASMRRPDDLTPEEATLAGQALSEIDAGEFAGWEDVKLAI